MKLIVLNQGRVAKVDDDVFEELSKYRWHHTREYARRSQQINKMRHDFYMHRLIAQPSEGMVVDHINGDTLDNRRENLRVCTPSQNSKNLKTSKNNTSGFKGVHYYESRNKWTAKIMVNRKEYNLGYFKTVEEAAKAYREAAKEHFGEFMREETGLRTHN